MLGGNRGAHCVRYDREDVVDRATGCIKGGDGNDGHDGDEQAVLDSSGPGPRRHKSVHLLHQSSLFVDASLLQA